MNPDPPGRLSCNFSSGGHDDPRTLTTTEMATDGVASQTFSHLEASSLQASLMQATQASVSSQSLRHDDQLMASPRDGQSSEFENRLDNEHLGLRSDNGFSAGTAGYLPMYPEFGVEFSEDDLGLRSNNGISASTGGYLPTYPEPGDAFQGENLGLRSDNGFTADVINYLPTYSESGVAFAGKAPGFSPAMHLQRTILITCPLIRNITMFSQAKLLVCALTKGLRHAS